MSMAVGLLAVAIVEAIGRVLLKLVPCLAFRNLKPDLDTYLKTWRARSPERRALGYPPLEVQAPTIAARLEVLGVRFPGSTFEEIRDDLPDLIHMAELGRVREARTRFPFDEDVASLIAWLVGTEKALAIEMDEMARGVGAPHFGFPRDIRQVASHHPPVRKGRDVDEPSPRPAEQVC